MFLIFLVGGRVSDGSGGFTTLIKSCFLLFLSPVVFRTCSYLM